MSEDGILDINFAPVNTGDNTDIQVSWVMIVSNKDIVEDVIVDKSELLTIINKANELLKETTKYTEESLIKLQEAVTEANEVYSNEVASTEEVVSAVEKVNVAIEALEEVPEQEIVDKTELQNKVNEANNIVVEKDKYTEESLSILKTTLEKAKEVLSNEEASIEEVGTVLEELKIAISKLEEIKVEAPLEVDKSKLEAAIIIAKKMDLSKYTKESADKFKKAITDAEVVLKDEEATESDVKNAIKAIDEAKKELKKTNTQGSIEVGGQTPGGSNSGSSSNDKLPQTGGIPITVIGLLATVSGISLYKRKK